MEGGGGGGPRVCIIEQPASKALRFRYECEGRSAGSIPGINSTAENKTYPTIQIENYQGRAVVVVSCVTKDMPYRPHPHNLVGKEGCKNGVCTMEVNTETMSLSFANLGIQCIKKKDIEEALKLREDLRIDPFKTGFGHKSQPGTIDLNAVRLCFQVFLEGSKKNQFSIPIVPVVSEPIYDKKAMSDLVICKLSECSASVIGGKEIILLCEKVAKDDISVRLYEEQNGQVLWEGQADFQPTEVHKQVAISFRTPRYKSIEVSEPVQVMIQLLRPSDKATSEPRPFQLTPLDAGRPTFWSLRRASKADYRTFASILHTDTRLMTKPDKQKPAVITLDSVGEEEEKNISKIKPDSSTISWPKVDDTYSLLNKTKHTRELISVDEGSVNVDASNGANLVVQEKEEDFNELLNQVSELDSFCNNPDDLAVGNDFGIYSSLQLAMKNPCEFMDFNESQPSTYEDIAPPRPTASKPPLPAHQQQSVEECDVDEMKDDTLPPLPPKRVKKSPVPQKTLPPLPEGKTKLSLFQKLFSSSKRNKNKSREGSISSMGSRRSLIEDAKPDVGGEVALTEAEHYALYTSLAPHATASEFDEMSFYYSPVEGRSNNNTDVPVK